MDERFRPGDLARATGISAATVRMYEREGILPPAVRTAAGHRRYRYQHLRALETARQAMRGYGWGYAREVMRAVHAGDLARVCELVDARHAAIDRERRELRATLDAVGVLHTAGSDARSRAGPERRGWPVRVGEAARLAGVRVSTIHFWEEQGLVSPARDRSSNYRVYSEADLRQVRMVVLLRRAGYPFAAIRSIFAALGQGNPEAAAAALQRRERDLHRHSRECMAATAALWRYIDEYADDATADRP